MWSSTRKETRTATTTKANGPYPHSAFETPRELSRSISSLQQVPPYYIREYTIALEEIKNKLQPFTARLTQLLAVKNHELSTLQFSEINTQQIKACQTNIEKLEEEISELDGKLQSKQFKEEYDQLLHQYQSTSEQLDLQYALVGCQVPLQDNFKKEIGIKLREKNSLTNQLGEINGYLINFQNMLNAEEPIFQIDDHYGYCLELIKRLDDQTTQSNPQPINPSRFLPSRQSHPVRQENTSPEFLL